MLLQSRVAHKDFEDHVYASNVLIEQASDPSMSGG